MAFVVNSFVYFSFANTYSSTILNYENFSQQFQSGIYQYRILSGHLLLGIYDFLSALNLNYEVFKFKFIDENSEPQMLLSFFLLNSIFLVFSVIVMNLITKLKTFGATSKEKLLLIISAVFFIVLSQFVLVPYDNSSYFFLLLFFYLLIKYVEKPSTLKLLILGVLIVVSTINRESSALSLALAATLLFSKYKLKKQSILPIAFLGIVFVITYVALRFSSENFTTNDGNLFFENLTQPKNSLGLLFWVVSYGLCLALSKSKKQIRAINVFHLFSLPYILMCFYSGILYEIRLYIPLFLTSLFLTQLDFEEKSE